MPRKSNSSRLIENLEQEQKEVKQTGEELKTGDEKDNDTRQKVAKLFVHFYFWILILIILCVPAYDYFVFKSFNNEALIISLKDTILTYSAVVGSTFGLVVAYYFKSSKKD